MDELTELFARLNALLVLALRAMQGAGGEADPVLGAYISERQVEQLMAAPPGTSPLWQIPRERLARLPGPVRSESRLGRLRDAFGLDDTDRGSWPWRWGRSSTAATSECTPISRTTRRGAG